MVKHKVVIEHSAKLQLKKAYEYVRNESYQNAEKIKDKILHSIKLLEYYPERHAPDKFCTENDGSFRAYEIFKNKLGEKEAMPGRSPQMRATSGLG